jgi:hypothetical protein
VFLDYNLGYGFFNLFYFSAGSSQFLSINLKNLKQAFFDGLALKRLLSKPNLKL